MDETPPKPPKCGATIQMGDDHGDNSTTFVCERPPDHEAHHVETGTMYGRHPYTITWEGDMREQCGSCDALVPESHYCSFCEKRACTACFGDDWAWCNECASKGLTYEAMCEDQLREFERKHGQ